jgi:hypothetical protein
LKLKIWIIFTIQVLLLRKKHWIILALK